MGWIIWAVIFENYVYRRRFYIHLEYEELCPILKEKIKNLG